MTLVEYKAIREKIQARYKADIVAIDRAYAIMSVDSAPTPAPRIKTRYETGLSLNEKRAKQAAYSKAYYARKKKAAYMKAYNARRKAQLAASNGIEVTAERTE